MLSLLAAQLVSRMLTTRLRKPRMHIERQPAEHSDTNAAIDVNSRLKN
jgi:hypothetical protein